MQITEKKLLSIKDFKTKYNLRTPEKTGTINISGWGSQSIALQKAIDECNPKSIIEVGTWLGASALFMSSICEAEIICVDTFLASNEVLWRENQATDSIERFDKIYEQFCVNITSQKMNDRIAPLPMTSSSAAELFQKEQITADLVYIDAGHREREVYADLQDYWPLTNKILVGDDYNPIWGGVISAADRFAYENQLHLQIIDDKFILRR